VTGESSDTDGDGQQHHEPLDPDPHGRDPEDVQELDHPDPGDLPDA
jgi:hypothetical protein